MAKNLNNYSFTIITPAYNTEKHIEICIRAVINSKYDLNKVEHIIVDDGSTDNTYEIVKKYADKFPHIKLYRKPNSNWGGVMNYVRHNELVHNDYVTICDSDDAIMPKAFLYVNKFSKNEDLIFGNFYKWNGKHFKFPAHSYYYLFKRLPYSKKTNKKIPPFLWMTHGTYCKKSIFYKMNNLKEKVSYQDNILIMEWFKDANTIRYINKGLEKYFESRPGNSSHFINNEKSILLQLENLKILEKNNLPEPLVNILIYFRALRKYCQKNKIVFTFKNKPKFNNATFLMRILMCITYHCSGVRKLIKIEK